MGHLLLAIVELHGNLKPSRPFILSVFRLKVLNVKSPSKIVTNDNQGAFIHGVMIYSDCVAFSSQQRFINPNIGIMSRTVGFKNGQFYSQSHI